MARLQKHPKSETYYTPFLLSKKANAFVFANAEKGQPCLLAGSFLVLDVTPGYAQGKTLSSLEYHLRHVLEIQDNKPRNHCNDINWFAPGKDLFSIKAPDRDHIKCPKP